MRRKVASHSIGLQFYDRETPPCYQENEGDDYRMALVLAAGLFVLASAQSAQPKISMMISSYHWKVPVGEERRFKEQRGDWVISVVLRREIEEDYTEKKHWAEEKPGWGRSPGLRSKTSIRRVDLIYKGQHTIVRTGLKNLYNMEWVRFDLVPGGFDMTMDIEAYEDESQAYVVHCTYRMGGIRRVVRDMIDEEVVETRTFRPRSYPRIL